MKRLLFILAIALLLVACQNDTTNSNNGDFTPKEFVALDVDPDFNWSNTRYLTLEVQGDATLLEGRKVTLENLTHKVSSAFIYDGTHTFTVEIPSELIALNVVCDELGFSQTISTSEQNQIVTISGTPQNKGPKVDSDGDGVDDLIDDFPNDPDKAVLIRVPAVDEDYWVFEDLWPDKGDYDFNDLVIREYVELHMSATNMYVGGRAKLWLNAIGANFHNSIFLHFMEASLVGGELVFNELADPDFVKSIETYLPNIRIDEYTPNTIGAWYDIEWEHFGYQNNGYGPQDHPHSREFNFTFDETGIQPSNLTFEWYLSIGNEREKELHHPMFAPTAIMNTSYFNTGDDATNIATGFYYKTALNHPWVVRVYGDFKNPKEFVQITEAYPHFQDWAESNGSLHPDWYNTYDQDKVFDEYSAK